MSKEQYEEPVELRPPPRSSESSTLLIGCAVVVAGVLFVLGAGAVLLVLG